MRLFGLDGHLVHVRSTSPIRDYRVSSVGLALTAVKETPERVSPAMKKL